MPTLLRNCKCVVLQVAPSKLLSDKSSSGSTGPEDSLLFIQSGRVPLSLELAITRRASELLRFRQLSGMEEYSWAPLHAQSNVSFATVMEELSSERRRPNWLH